MNTAKHSVSVAAVVTDDHGRALLVQRRDNDHWEPPGGVLELGESIEDGLRREAREETGLDIEPIALTGIYKNMTRGIIALVFRCKTTGGGPAPRDARAASLWAEGPRGPEPAPAAFRVGPRDGLGGSAPPAGRMAVGHSLVIAPSAWPP